MTKEEFLDEEQEKERKKRVEQILADKGLKDLLNNLNPAFRQNRVFYGTILTTGGQELECDLLNEEDESGDMFNFGLGSKLILPKSLFWDELFGFLITSKAWVTSI